MNAWLIDDRRGSGHATHATTASGERAPTAARDTARGQRSRQRAVGDRVADEPATDKADDEQAQRELERLGRERRRRRQTAADGRPMPRAAMAREPSSRCESHPID